MFFETSNYTNKEAFDRNKIIKIDHNTTIPTIALWGEYHIEQETKEERINWWNEFKNHPNQYIQNTAVFWINCLNTNISNDIPE